MRLFLIGMPGCGKSTIGQQLACALSLLFVDLDTEIAQKENTTVSAIFSKKGEEYFRKREREVLAEFCDLDTDFVMATGGGTPCFFANMERINETGISIFLDVSVKEIFARLNKISTLPLPLLSAAGKNTSVQRIAEVRNARMAFYRQAHLVFSGHQISRDIILKEVGV